MHSSVPGWLSGFAFIAGWVLMTLAMMLPTTLPLVVRFQTMFAKRDQAGLLISLLIVGYLAAWLGFGFVALPVQAEQMYVCLKTLGRETALILYPGEGHGIQKLPHRLDMGERIVAFCNEHLLSGA